MSNDFPYQKYQLAKMWSIINQAIEDLVDNTDIEEMTDRKYIVGYLCKALSDGGIHIED